MAGRRRTLVTLVARCIDQGSAVVEQRMTGDRGSGRSAVVRESVLSLRLGKISCRARRSLACCVKVAGKVRERLLLRRRTLGLRRGAEGAGRAELERDVVCRVRGVRRRGVVLGLAGVSWSSRGRRHGGDILGDVSRDRNHSEMPIASCRNDGRGMRFKNRMDIYIALRFPFLILRENQKSLLLRHGQKKDRNPTHHCSFFLCFLSLPVLTRQSSFPAREEQICHLSQGLPFFPRLFPSLTPPPRGRTGCSKRPTSSASSAPSTSPSSSSTTSRAAPVSTSTALTMSSPSSSEP